MSDGEGGPRRRRRGRTDHGHNGRDDNNEYGENEIFNGHHPPTNRQRPLRIVFVHLDLGIGGAEQLVINLASASLPMERDREDDASAAEGCEKTNEKGEGGQEEERSSTPSPSSSSSSTLEPLNAQVLLYTTHRSPTHCFSEVKPPHGKLASSVRIRGAFLPRTVFGVGTALCSAIRIVYATHCAMRDEPDADLVVLDVLPTPIPWLVCRWCARAVLFYCHFPDKLLTRDTINGVPVTTAGAGSGDASGADGASDGALRTGGLAAALATTPRKWYRAILDAIEERTMRYADLIVVNSNFTRGEVFRVFPTLRRGPATHPEAEGGVEAGTGTGTSAGTRSEGDAFGGTNGDDDDRGRYVRVLYPAIDLSKFIQPDFDAKASRTPGPPDRPPIVSLNRFERKKNVPILLRAYAKLIQTRASNAKSTLPPKLIVAGGYDPRNVENVEHLAELRRLAAQLDIFHLMEFRPSVSDDERATLLRSALCVVYTPNREHFGIVPLEAMYAGSPVVAVRSGGPMETIVDGVTGYLVENTVEGFATALYELVDNVDKAVEMGRAGHDHVRTKFGLNVFRVRWAALVRDAMKRGNDRRERWGREGTKGMDIFPVWVGYGVDAVVAFVLAWSLTWSLRAMGLLDPGRGVWGTVGTAVRRRWGTGDEL